MNIFIPDIGTKLTLTRPWTFDLWFEHRNEGLIEKELLAAGFDNTPTFHEPTTGKDRFGNPFTWTNPPTIPMRTLMWGGRFHRDRKETKAELEKARAVMGDRFILDDVNGIITTLPKGSVLTVDRIYIRKGQGYGKFSSISFYLTLPQKSKQKGRLRFWAKLKDVNTIVADVVEVERK